MIDSRRLGSLAALAAVSGATAFGLAWALRAPPAADPKPPPAVPANVVKAAKEDDFNTVTLPPEAEKALAIRVGTAERKPMPRERAFAGEVAIPAGQSMVVAAPLSGTLVAPDAGVPKPGTKVAAKTPVFLLRPLLTPDGQATMAAAKADADGQVENARTAVDLARIALDRNRKLQQDGNGSQRLVDEAKAAFDTAEKTLAATTERRDLLKKVLGDAADGTAAPIAVPAPEGWLVRNVSASPGQTVPAGAALFEVANLAAVWVRVPLTPADLAEIDPAGPAKVGPLAAKPGDPVTAAKPVAAPPAANALAGTVDRFYEMPNPAGLSPGERVGVSLPVAGNAADLTVPWSAIVHDFHGGTWVYERLAERTYARRRVVVRFVAGGTAVLKEGANDRVKSGTVVVIAGAEELFGTETGYSK